MNGIPITVWLEYLLGGGGVGKKKEWQCGRGQAQSTYNIEYRSVCALVGIGTSPPPLPRKRVCPTLRNQKGGWDTLARGWGGGGGVPIPTTIEKT